MPGRTDQQCMGRWRRHLDPNIRKCQWQTHEDELLKQQYEALGPQWSNISKFLQGRTAQQCRARWFQLCPASAAPPVPRTARNQNGRRDRHHDGASIQESARQLVAQMGGTQGTEDGDDGSMQPMLSGAASGDIAHSKFHGVVYVWVAFVSGNWFS
jgi:Myb-like DNA-binding domain